MISPLPNYLRAHRKRSAFSQDEIAFLLGARSGGKICRYERFLRLPPLEAALAYEIIFRRPARDLFSGLYQRIEEQVAARAKVLTFKIDRQMPSRTTALKRQLLVNLALKQRKSSLDS
jgi:hypothetical protein